MKLIEIPPGKKIPKEVNAIIEIPRGSRNKFEYDIEMDVFRLDRVLYSPMHYPTNYGFIPSTLDDDGDPLDIMVITEEPTFTGCLIEVRPIGVLAMEDDKGIDDKILAVPIRDPRFDKVTMLDQIAPHTLKEIEYFYSIYKDLEGKKSKTMGWRGIYDAEETILNAIKAYKK